MTSRRTFIAALAAAAAPRLGLAAQPPDVEVYLEPTWGCCGAWIEHLRANGFRVKPVPVEDTSVYRRRYGIPDALGGCHTARVEGYAVEGHVPAREIKRLLAERPKARGLAVPGMPAGSPGMEGTKAQPYDVLLVKPDGTSIVYQSYRWKESSMKFMRFVMLALVLALASPLVEATNHEQGGQLTQGEVRKVDKHAKKITIRHGPIQNLDMPAMTMVFQVTDPAMLDRVKAGDKVNFAADKIGGQITVTRIEPAK
jgi:Cu/Ag efflux protein CusF